MPKFGLIGEKLGHSFSKRYFTDKFEKLDLSDHSYENCEIPSIDGFQELKNSNFNGFNVTIPYKETIMPLLSSIDAAAERIGAVNTLKREGDDWIGYNTDAFGFHQTIKPFLKPHHDKALILGKGGASKAVAHVLKEYGIDINFMTRTPGGANDIGWDKMNENVVKFHKLIVNTTPLGMFPNIHEYPQIAYEGVNEKHLVVDLIYNPLETTFMKKSSAMGAVALNGLTMLHQQAEKSWEIWNS